MKKIIFFTFVSLFVVAMFFSVPTVLGNDLSNVNYPVAELENCASQEECGVYCDNSDNMEKCISFAENKGILAQEEIEVSRKMLESIEDGGPGGCTNQSECDVYCDNINHIEECLIFAEENDLLEMEELEEGKKVLQAIKEGIEPPKCESKKECDAYCALPANMEECISFGEAAGLIPPEELEGAHKVLDAIKSGVEPLPCSGKQDCDLYCEQENHIEECINFAEAAGFMDAEDAQMARKTGGKGPGGCKGEEECKSFCDNPENLKTCIEFSAENGLMPQEEAEKTLKMIESGSFFSRPKCEGSECEEYCADPAHIEECLNYSVQSGEMTIEEKEELLRKMNESKNEGPEILGPGGCKTEEECKAYCENYPEKCNNSGGGSQENPSEDEQYGEEQFYPAEEPMYGPNPDQSNNMENFGPENQLQFEQENFEQNSFQEPMQIEYEPMQFEPMQQESIPEVQDAMPFSSPESFPAPSGEEVPIEPVPVSEPVSFLQKMIIPFASIIRLFSL